MAQYVATLDSSEVPNENVERYKCDCLSAHDQQGFHFCPADLRFMPSNFCRQHIECNDPIYICFDIAKLCTDFGNRAPEYAEECKHMSIQIIEFSVNLLHQCSNTDEVELLLSEKAGLAKYMRFVKSDLSVDQNYFKHPRLILAAELNYKEFVSHMHCQQILRQQWHGRREWEGKPLSHKVR